MKGKRAGPSPGRARSEEYDVCEDCYVNFHGNVYR